MSSLSKKYWEALGISYDKSKAALDRAHEIRKFEIELYWKRATYFWALQLAAFTGFGVLWHEAHLSSRLLALLFTAVGAATAHAGWLSVRGPKFWQENWEKHIDCLEVRFEGNLHKTIWLGPKGVQFSVSRLNEHLNLILFIFWCAILLATSAYIVCTGLKLSYQPAPWLVSIAGPVTAVAALIAAVVFLFCTQSTLEGMIYEEDADDWQRFPGNGPQKYSILRRYGPGETEKTVFNQSSSSNVGSPCDADRTQS